VEGGSVVLDDGRGRLELGVLVEDVLGIEGGGAAVGAGGPAEAWDGDRYVLVERADRSRALVFVVIWESGRARDRFADAVERAAHRFGAPPSVERTAVEGRPATVLRIAADGVSVSASLSDMARSGAVPDVPRPGAAPELPRPDSSP